jgi:hypothetical protein
VSTQRPTSVPFDHPQVGELRLHRERLAIGGTDGVTVVVYHPDAGSPGAEKLALLGSSALAPADGSSRRARGESVPPARP